MSAARLLNQQDALPRCDYATRLEMVQQLTAMVRGTRLGSDDLPQHYWQEMRDDHLRHAHNYATVAATIMTSAPKVPDVLKQAGGHGMMQVITGINAVTGKEGTVVAKQYPQEPPGVIDERTGRAVGWLDPGDVYAPLKKRKPPEEDA
jgi:hypothetical protein